MLAGKIHEIRAIFDQNPTFVRQSVLPHEKEQISILELEAKYGYYTDRGFNSNVPYVHYERLLALLRASQDVKEELEESTVTQVGNIRRIVIINPGNGHETVIWQEKQRLKDIEFKEFDIRVSLNVEKSLDPSNPPSFTGKKIIRERTRHSFLMPNGLVKVDMTEVMMRAEDQIVRPRYEVELEYLGTQADLNVFVQQADYIFKLLRGTNIVFSNQMKSSLIHDTIKILGGTRGDMIDKDVFVEARNIKRRDLVYGGIVGNHYTMDEKVLANPRRQGHTGSGTNYMITFKADGLRKMLIIHTTGIWLVYPPFEFNLVLNMSINIPQLDRLLTSLNGTILDGELVIPKVPKPITYWYLAFDCLAFRGKSGIQLQSYIERQKIVNAVAGSIKTPILTIDTKETEEIKSSQDFFLLVNKFLDKRDELEYSEDGLMFIPIDVCYNPRSQRNELRDRSLTQIPDTCKWKEGEDITIDFALKWVDGGLELHSYDEKLGDTVPFIGDMINPLTPNMIDHTNPLTLNTPSGLIVEYEWVGGVKLLSSDVGGMGTSGILRPRRIRYDKSGPNKLAIAIDDWEDIMNPILEDDIRGDTLKMTFSYHNRIKKGLYNLLTSNPNFNPKIRGSNLKATNLGGRPTFEKRYIGVNILDIGSGFGGDTAKWLRLTDKDDPANTGIVIAVEPNPNNRQQLSNRIETYGLQNKVVIVPTGGEDTVTITDNVRRYVPGGKVDAVTLMLSMSFFWASDSHLDALVNTIVNNLKPGGKIVFLTIDGDTIEQIFEPALGGPHITDLTISSANLHLYPKPQLPFGRPLDFVLPNTIVGDQREYIVHLQDFTSRLATYGIFLYETHRAEGEKLLSDDNTLFSSMYTYGYYMNDDKIALLQNDQPGRLPRNTVLPNIPVTINLSDTEMYQYLPPTDDFLPKTTILGTPVISSPRLMEQPYSPGPETFYRFPSPRPIVPLPQSPRPIVPLPQSPRPVIFLPQSPRPVLSLPQSPRPVLSLPQSPRPVVSLPQSPRPVISLPQSPRQIVPLPQSPRPVGQLPILPPLLHGPNVNIPTIYPLLTQGNMPQIPTTMMPIMPVMTMLGRMTKFQIETNQLEWLSVPYTGRGGRIIRGPAHNDDTYAPLKCTWYENVVRIATIGDGSCFIHAVLKAFFKIYQENTDAHFRLELAAKTRRDLAVALGHENPQYPGYSYWLTSARGAFPRMVMQQIRDEELVSILRVDYSLSGIQRLFNSTSQLGDEVYTYVSDVLSLDIFILRATRQDLHPHYHTKRPGISRNGIVIIGNMYHYEVLAINTDEGFQTVFPPDDPFINALTELFIGDGDFNDIMNTIPYDPDKSFVDDFVESFTIDTGLVIPSVINEIFTSTDPFTNSLDRLMPEIQNLARSKTLAFLPEVVHTENNVLVELDHILDIMRDSGYQPDQVRSIREIVQHRMNPDIPQDLDTIVTAALTDGLLTSQQVEDILNTRATL